MRENAIQSTRRMHEHFADCDGEAALNQLLYVDCKTFLPDFNLTYTDKLSMACSIEARVPFLDNKVVDFCLTLPPDLKIHRLTQKYVLRRAMQERLPSSIIHRRKAGFGLPVRSWLRGELREMLNDLLSETRVRQRGLFQTAEVSRLIQENQSGKQDYTLRLWSLLTFELWHQTFLDSAANSTPAVVSGVATA